jgi:outer membrane protein assembly factor BamD (BamD/ComL family)
LAESYEHDGAYLPAAKTFAHIADAFPRDSLAADALLRAGAAYASLWGTDESDTASRSLALAAFERIHGSYAASPRNLDADIALRALREYQISLYYERKRAYESALLYLRGIASALPRSVYARMALLRAVEIYRTPQVGRPLDAAATCATLRSNFGGARDVRRVCSG